MIGGYNGSPLSNVELYPRPPSDTCSVPHLPQARTGPSLSLLSGGRLIVCGGFNYQLQTSDSCLSWVAGNATWTPSFTMRCLLPPIKKSYKITKDIHRVARAWHTAWTPSSLSDSIVLLGGWTNEAHFTAEIVPGIRAKVFFQSFSKIPVPASLSHPIPLEQKYSSNCFSQVARYFHSNTVGILRVEYLTGTQL